MPNPSQSSQSPAPKDERKELEKVLKAYVEVFVNKNGRAPSLEELTAELADNNDGQGPVANPADGQLDDGQQPATDAAPEGGDPQDTGLVPDGDDGVPSFLNYKIVHGMKDGQPDKFNTLYYLNPQDGSCFDCADGSWMSEAPRNTEHLPCRDMVSDRNAHGEIEDVFQAILHGVVDDNSFNALKSKNMISPNAEKLFNKTKQLKMMTDAMEKSIALTKSDDEVPEEEVVEEDTTAEEPTGETADEPEETPVNSDESFEPQEEEPAQAGEDVIAAIVDQAMGEAMNSVRAIVRDELAKLGYGSSEEEPEEESAAPETEEETAE